jgi:hypothetical protein
VIKAVIGYHENLTSGKLTPPSDILYAIHKHAQYLGTSKLHQRSAPIFEAQSAIKFSTHGQFLQPWRRSLHHSRLRIPGTVFKLSEIDLKNVRILHSAHQHLSEFIGVLGLKDVPRLLTEDKRRSLWRPSDFYAIDLLPKPGLGNRLLYVLAEIWNTISSHERASVRSQLCGIKCVVQKRIVASFRVGNASTTPHYQLEANFELPVYARMVLRSLGSLASLYNRLSKLLTRGVKRMVTRRRHDQS